LRQALFSRETNHAAGGLIRENSREEVRAHKQDGQAGLDYLRHCFPSFAAGAPVMADAIDLALFK